MTATETEQRTIEYAQERLTEWGQWVRNLRGVQLGYSSHAAFISERVDNDHDDMLMDDTANNNAQEVEAILCRMAKLGPSMHRALIECYLLRTPQVVAAQACHCSIALFRARLRMGEMWVASRLLGEPLEF